MSTLLVPTPAPAQAALIGFLIMLVVTVGDFMADPLVALRHDRRA